MNLGFARNLSNVDGDEVSLVRRPANKRRFLLMKGVDGVELDPEIADILTVPAPDEGALMDMVRKDGADEVTENAVTMAARLLHSVGADLTRETVEKLGSQMYSASNPELNSGHGQAGQSLNGEWGKGPNVQGSAFAGDWDNTDTRADDDTGYEIDTDDANYDEDAPADLAALGKRDVSTDERKNLAGKGKALPDGSFPIANKSDLGNAIKAYGRAKNKGRAKAFIISRAKSLGATSMLPEGWNVSKSDENDDTNEGGDPVETHAVPIQKEDGTWDLSGVPAESRPYFEATLQKADALASELEATKERLEKSDEKAQALADTLKTRDLVAKAELHYGKVGPADEIATILKSASSTMDENTYEMLESVLKSANERIETGDLFAELGRASRGESQKTGSAYAEAVAKADEIVSKGDMNRDEALGKVWMDNPGLYDRYLAENPAMWATGPVDATVAAAAATHFAGGDQ